jgi:hypothetical protein
VAGGNRAPSHGGAEAEQQLREISQDEANAWALARIRQQRQKEYAFGSAIKTWRDGITKAVRKNDMRAKLLIRCLRFNEHTFHAGHGLVSNQSQRDLAKIMCASVRTVRRALLSLEATGRFKISRRFNPDTKQYKVNRYHAIHKISRRKIPF